MQSSRSAVRIYNDQNKNANESGGEFNLPDRKSELRGDIFAHKREPLVSDPWPSRVVKLKERIRGFRRARWESRAISEACNFVRTWRWNKEDSVRNGEESVPTCAAKKRDTKRKRNMERLTQKRKRVSTEYFYTKCNIHDFFKYILEIVNNSSILPDNFCFFNSFFRSI